jgi:hypothetical protein
MSPESEEWELALIVGTAVCLTHERFVPCRKNDGCVISTKQEDIDHVTEHQRGC